MRLREKTAIVVGAGQSPGSGMGNGRATALRFAQEGAQVMAVDRALFLASDEASFITGVDLLVDGGDALDIGH